MSYSSEQEKVRRARKKLRDERDAYLRMADSLTAKGAPPLLVEDAEQRAHELKLRLWGWIGPVSRVHLDREHR